VAAATARTAGGSAAAGHPAVGHVAVKLLLAQNRRDFVKLLAGGVALATTGVIGGACSSAPSTDPWDRAVEILARVRPPTFPNQSFDITAYGAIGDGINDCSEAISRAMAACAAAGGGRIVVPPGRFSTGPIHLESNVELHLQKDATVAFSPDPDKYLPAVFTRWSGIECFNYSPCIYAFEKTNIAITGEGTLDGSAANDNWWRWKGLKQFGATPGTGNELAAFARLQDMAQRGVPVERRMFGNGDFLRPAMLQLYRCRNALIEDVSFVRSPMWVIHPVLSSNVTVRGVTVDSHGPNNDGCDPESCTDVLIENCTFNTGDDCIAIKSGRNNDGRRIATPSTNIVVRHCRMENGHGALTVGSEISGGAHHIFFEASALVGPKLWWAMDFRNNAQRGGIVEHVYCRDITLSAASVAAIGVDFQYGEVDDQSGPYKPVLRDVAIANLTCASANRVMDVRNIPTGTVDQIAVKSSVFSDVHMPSLIDASAYMELADVRVNGRSITTGTQLAD
jgi:polygalacturonase